MVYLEMHFIYYFILEAAMNYDTGNEAEEESVIAKYTSALHQ